MSIDLRLVSWNLHGTPLGSERRRRRMRAAAQAMVTLTPPPNLVLLQEVFLPADAARIERHLGVRFRRVDGIPLKAFPPWFLPLLNLGGLWWSIRRGGLLAFVDDTWEVLGSAFEPFDAEDWEIKLWRGDGYADKGFHRLHLRHRPSGQPLVVLNTHLQSGRTYEDIRAAQLAQLRRAIAAIPVGVPVVIAGDFNVRPTSALYRALTEDLGWRDLTVAVPNCGTEFDRAAAGRWRDYVFLRADGGWGGHAEVGLICNRKRDRPYSDHHGVDARIRLRPQASAALPLATVAAQVWQGPATRRAWLLAGTTLLCAGAWPARGRG
jgi:endonuclease/exonuclease/phosphatase family metal-dependent hydrolase